MLQQPATFNPFARQFIPFTEITGGASQYNIINIIRTATAQRNEMFNVIDVFPTNFLKFNLTIIAFMSLALQLLFNLLTGICAAIIKFVGAPPLGCTRGLIVRISTSLTLARPSITGISVSAEVSDSRRLSFLALRALFSKHWLFTCKKAISINCLTGLTPIAQSVLASLIAIKELFGSGIFPFAVDTPFMTFPRLLRLRGFPHSFAIGIAANFALPIQSIGGLIQGCAIEKLSSSRFNLFAGSTLFKRDILGYDVRHSEASPLQMCSLGSEGVTSTLTTVRILPHQYTTNPPVAQRQGVICFA